jgi:hypothetical protein
MAFLTNHSTGKKSLKRKFVTPFAIMFWAIMFDIFPSRRVVSKNKVTSLSRSALIKLGHMVDFTIAAEAGQKARSG